MKALAHSPLSDLFEVCLPHEGGDSAPRSTSPLVGEAAAPLRGREGGIVNSVSASPCPVPGCPGEVPKRAHFCPEHYFRLPQSYTSLIFRMDFKAERAASDADEAYFSSARQGYIETCVKRIVEEDMRR
jgi:hypothetical protein